MHLEPTDEQAAFQHAAAVFARSVVAPRAAAIDATDEFPAEIIAEAGRQGFLGVTITESRGGAGRDYVAYALALEAIARASATVAVIMAVNNSLVAEVIDRFGSDAQRDRWLRPLATGTMLGAFALSERDAGTDAANQQTRAVRDGRWYRLTGDKVWVANAAAADVAIVFAASGEAGARREISAFLVPLDLPGVTRQAENDALGVRGLGCRDVTFRDVHLAVDQRLGGAGEGFAIARWGLEGGRIAIAAQALGVGQAALDEALEHARRRRTFGQPIGSYQAVQWMLADTATDLEAARVLTWRAAALKSHGAATGLDASMAKLLASEAARRASDHAMQILASAGYRRGSRVERLYRDARATEIYQGTSEVQRMIIAAGVLAR